GGGGGGRTPAGGVEVGCQGGPATPAGLHRAGRPGGGPRGRGVQAQSRLDRSRMNCDDCGGGGRRGNGRARGKGAGMPSWLTGGAGTLVLATLSAYAFLRLRCRRAGQPFGPRAKRWAVTIILLTAIVSTGLGLA